MNKVFIDGTLKRGFPLFQKGLANASLLGLYRTVEPYPLFIAADFYGPMMLNSPGEGLRVEGELYSVSDAELKILDQLEDVGSPGSYREKLLIEPLDGGVREEAVGFFKSENWLHPLHSGYLSNYQDRRFIPPWER